MAGRELKIEADQLNLQNGEIVSTIDPTKKVKISSLSELKRQGVILGVGYRGPNPDKKVVNPFAAQFCELEVNIQTGEVSVIRFLAAQESGRVMNHLGSRSRLDRGKDPRRSTDR
jgi:CO/xanthine dehydrogenase Mo-binding subunit